MNKNRLLVAALLSLSLPAQRGEPAPRPARAGLSSTVLLVWIARYDTDRDGKVSRAEYPRGDVGFANLDRDGNGFVELIDAAVRQPVGARGRRPATPRAAKAPAVGDVAPDFELPLLGMKDEKVKLSRFAGDRPVALIFGSYT